LLIHCDSHEAEYVPFSDHVLIVDSGVRRELRHGAFNVRQRECATALAWMRAAGVEAASLALAPPDVFKRVPFGEPLGNRARHVIEEQARVAEAVASLRATKHLPGNLLLASHESLRTLYECSSPELDWIVNEVSESAGVSGARLTGAGWGGCVIALADDDVALKKAADALVPRYAKQFGQPCDVWVTRASPGAYVERV
jgi:galactokinase